MEFSRERRGFFDCHAATWEEKLRYEEKSERLKNLVALFELRRGDSILDVGTGTGVLLPFLRKGTGKEGLVTAMDFSFKMVEKAKDRHPFLVNGSVEAIPFRPGEFDRVTCFSAFPHFPDKKKALLEMVRVLKQDGHVFIAHLHSVEEINQFHRQMGGVVGHDRLPEPDHMLSLMKESGLSEVVILNEPGKFLARGRKV